MIRSRLSSCCCFYSSCAYCSLLALHKRLKASSFKIGSWQNLAWMFLT